MITVRSFRSKILLALVAVALIPAGITVAMGTLALREFVSGSGTAGPWESVAESGRELLDEVEAGGVDDPELEAAAARHRQALTESVRLSRIYRAVSDRFLQLLPYFAVVTVLLVAGLSLLAARFLSRIFSRPIQELIGWTERIARGRPLPDRSEIPPPDVREFELLREALRSMASELEEGRTRAVESARLRSWTEMARSVAHELKNPLAPMRMAAGTVAMLDEPRAAEAGQVLLEEIDRLDAMARSFSRLGRMPEGPTAEVDVGELLAEVAAPYREGPVRVELEVDPDLPLVEGWYDSLLRIFQNLVGNAVEAAEVVGAAGEPGGGRAGSDAGGGSEGDRAGSRAAEAASACGEGPWVRVRAVALTSPVAAGHSLGSDPAPASVEVTVIDSGAGIPDGALSGIWEPDYTTKPRGTGLGLTLVRQAVEAHGGRIRVGNAPDAGAEFTVVLPLRPPAAP